MNPNDPVFKQVVKGLGSIAEETGKEVLKQGEEVLHSVITGKELLGDAQPMTDQEMAQRKADDERKKQEEINKLRAQMGQGRPIEEEMEKIRREREQKEEQEERQEARAEENQHIAESQSYVVEIPGNAKKSAAKHQGAGGGHKKKSQQPDPSQMSQTSEFKKGID